MSNRASHLLRQRHSFATLISTGAQLTASQLPVLLDPARGPSGTLRSHMAKLNPQWQTFREDADVLVIFQGPHAYISPTWYASQTKVPTWNYATIHAYGRPKIIDRPAASACPIVASASRASRRCSSHKTHTHQPTPAAPYGSLLLLAWVLAFFYLWGTVHRSKQAFITTFIRRLRFARMTFRALRRR